MADHGATLWALDRSDEGRIVADEALVRARALGDDHLVASALVVVLAFHPGAADGSVDDDLWALYDEALVRAEGCGTRVTASLLGNNAAQRALEAGDVAAARAYLDRALAQGVWQNLGHLRCTLGMVLIAEQDYDAARSELHALLLLVRRTGARELGAYALANLAEIEQRLGLPRTAARLMGAAEGLMARLDGTWQTIVARTNSARIDALRGALGEPTFRAEFDEGRALSPDNAVILGLDLHAGAAPTGPGGGVL